MKFILQISNEVPFVQPSSQHKLKNSASCFRECVNDESCAVVAIGDESLFVAQEHERNCLMYSNRSVLLQTGYEDRWKVYAKVLIYSILNTYWMWSTPILAPILKIVMFLR